MATLGERPEYRLGHFGSVLVVVWFKEPTVASLDELEGHHVALAARFTKVTLLSVLVSASANPPVEVRRKIEAQTPTLQKLRHGNVAVVLAKGLAAIFIRTYLAALSLVSSEYMRVCKSVDEAALVIRRMPGQDPATRDNEALATELNGFVQLPPPEARPASVA